MDWTIQVYLVPLISSLITYGLPAYVLFYKGIERVNLVWLIIVCIVAWFVLWYLATFGMYVVYSGITECREVVRFNATTNTTVVEKYCHAGVMYNPAHPLLVFNWTVFTWIAIALVLYKIIDYVFREVERWRRELERM